MGRSLVAFVVGDREAPACSGQARDRGDARPTRRTVHERVQERGPADFQETLHPNSAGHRKAAVRLIETLESLAGLQPGAAR